MKRFLKAIVCSSLILGASTISAQPESPAVIAKHQLSECMTKRMSTNRSLSYIDAMRACKERLQPPKDLASINPIETGTKGH
jgi:Flp pilus assembly protein TadD